MVHYSVVIPERNSVERVRQLTAELDVALQRLLLPYEILCVDDGSESASAGDLATLCSQNPRMRLLRFDEPRGTSAALSAGIAAAHGDLVIAVGTASGTCVERLAHLVAELSQHDLVLACRERSLARELRLRCARWWRTISRRSDLAPDETMFWVAPRSAVARLALPRGAFRLLPELMAGHGYRVGELTILADLRVRSRPYVASWLGRSLAGWFARRFEPHLARETAQAGAPPAWQPRTGRLVTMRSAPAATMAVSDIQSNPH